VKVDLRTAELIVTQTQQNLMDIANEIEKILLSNLNAKTFSFEDVSKIIGYTRENSVYDLSNAIAARNEKKSFSILLNILKTPYQETIIIAVLRDLFIKIFKLIDLQAEGNTKDAMAKQIGVHPFYLSDYLIALEKYSTEEINNAFIVLSDTDKKIKSTTYNKKLDMQEMLANIVSAK
jgi:DNA polymerase-3 subunit delta